MRGKELAGHPPGGRLVIDVLGAVLAVLVGVPVLALRKSTPAPRLTLRVDPALPDLYRADYEGPPPNVYGRGGTVKVHYRRSPLDWRRSTESGLQPGCQAAPGQDFPLFQAN